MPAVTLLTDYGNADTYVGQVKGAILRVAPGALLVDLTHAVPPQDVRAGAFLLWTAVEAFPDGTVHLAVVDPGVGTSRRAIAVRTRRGDLLVGPDGGLLVPAAERLGGVALAVELTRQQYWGPARSRTFHGRDLFGPVAAHLAQGVALEELGPPVEVDRSVAFPVPQFGDGRILGEVLHVDAFGNLVTNIPAGALPERFWARLGGLRIAGPQPHYQAMPVGGLLAIVGSTGLLEISARERSAAKELSATRGAPVLVEPAGASPG